MADIAQLGIKVTTSGVKQASLDLDQFSKSSKNAVTSLGQFQQANKMASGESVLLGKAIGQLKSLFLAYASVQGALGILKTADEFRSLQNQLRVVIGTGQDLNTVFKNLLQVANDTRNGIDETTNLYAKLARYSKNLGLSQQNLLDVTEAVNKAVTISGVTSASASAGIYQFTQAIASNRLGGDELRSVMEQVPRLAQAIAEGMGISIGQLRNLGQQGKLTSDQVIKALLDQKQVLDNEFGKSVVTLGQAITVLKNNFVDFVGQLDSSAGITTTLGKGVLIIADAFKVWGVYMEIVVASVKALWAVLKALATALGAIAQFIPVMDLIIAGLRKLKDFLTSDDFLFRFQDGIAQNLALLNTVPYALEQVVKFAGDAFDGILKLAIAFMEDLKNVLHGDLTFGNFKAVFDQIKNNFTNSASEAVKNIQDAYKKNLSQAQIDVGLKSAFDPSRNDAGDKVREMSQAEQKLSSDLAFEASNLNILIQARQKGNAEFEKTLQLTEAYKKLREAGVDEGSSYYNQLLNEILANEKLQDQLDMLKKKQEDLNNTFKQFGSTIADAFSSAVTEGKSLSEVLQKLLQDLAKIAIQGVFRQIFSGIINGGGKGGQGIFGSFLGGLFGGASANGNVFQHGSMQKFASGGVVSSPTTFPMSGGKFGLMGEAGAEAIMPLTRVGGKLGVKAIGGGGSTTVNNITVNANGGTQDQNQDLAKRIAFELNAEMKRVSSEQIENAKRPGNSLNSGLKI